MKINQLIFFIILTFQSYAQEKPNIVFNKDSIELMSLGLKTKYKSENQLVDDLLLISKPKSIMSIAILYYWSIQNIKYSENYWVNSDQVLKERKANCQSLSKMFISISNQLGFESRLVTGRTIRARNSRIISKNDLSESHSWVKTKINGQWYFTDLVWGQSAKDKDECWNYFNTTSEFLSFTHIASNRFDNYHFIGFNFFRKLPGITPEFIIYQEYLEISRFRSRKNMLDIKITNFNLDEKIEVYSTLFDEKIEFKIKNHKRIIIDLKNRTSGEILEVNFSGRTIYLIPI
ncbi:MAG: transglutaminase-like domain-containing protein [Bacteroidetes bacterium]|nr:transglutaminase-like domain-containing protein [Bacteroidota bacterium]